MPDPVYDVETFLKNTLAIFRDNLDAEIDLIDTEKGDFTLDKIDTDAYYFNLTPKNTTFKVFISYGILNEPNVDELEGGSLREITLQFEVGLPDQNWPDNESGAFRILRYRRVLESIVSKNYRKFGGGKKPVITALAPASLTYKGAKTNFAGINLTIILDS